VGKDMHTMPARIHRHTKSPIGSFDLPNARFRDIHVDVVGPLPESHGHKYLLTCVDKFTRWPEPFQCVIQTPKRVLVLSGTVGLAVLERPTR
jgi:hypothetical protein